jgi:hypothetical protein
MARRYWYRLCVDIDEASNPIGGSWEKHVDEATVVIGVLGVEPFDSVFDALQRVLDSVDIQQRLF